MLELDFDTQRFRIGWDEITCEEDQGLKILAQERSKWQQEDAERRKAEIEEQQRRARDPRRQGF